MMRLLLSVVLVVGAAAPAHAGTCAALGALPAWSAPSVPDPAALTGAWWTWGYSPDSSSADKRSGMRLEADGRLLVVAGSRTGVAATQMGVKPTPTPWVDQQVTEGNWSVHQRLQDAVAALCAWDDGYSFPQASWEGASALASDARSTLQSMGGTDGVDPRQGPFLAMRAASRAGEEPVLLLATPYRVKRSGSGDQLRLRAPGVRSDGWSDGAWMTMMVRYGDAPPAPVPTGATQSQ